MDTFAYLNGQFIPSHTACVSPLDRGFIFGDGVYEVIPVYHNTFYCLEEHLDRLNQSLHGIRMTPPYSHTEWKTILKTLVQKNKVENQWVYVQVTRGVDPVRDHQFPKKTIPTIFAISYPKTLLSKQEQSQGIKTITVNDIRWKHCDIKTTARLAYVLMFQEAKDKGADEAIIINNGFVLEGTISNIFIVQKGVIITPPKSSQLLSGITRDRILLLAEKNKIPYRESNITEEDLIKAEEVWTTSSGRGLHPVIENNGKPIGAGKAGPLWNQLWDLYVREIDSLSLSIPH